MIGCAESHFFSGKSDYLAEYLRSAFDVRQIGNTANDDAWRMEE